MTPETDMPTPVNLVDLMNALVLPPEPEAVSMFPQTMGWVILGAVLAVGLLVLAILLHAHWRENSYRRDALAALPEAAATPERLAHLVRQTALAAYPRSEVAGLYGQDWLSFLDRTCDGAQFSSGAGAFLIKAPYVKNAHVTPDAVEAVRHWIARHKRGGVS